MTCALKAKHPIANQLPHAPTSFCRAVVVIYLGEGRERERERDIYHIAILKYFAGTQEDLENAV